MSWVRLPRTAQQLRLRENQIFFALTIIIGVLAGLAAVLFNLAITATTRALFGLTPSWPRLLLVPPLVSLVTGVLLVRFFPSVRGSGVPQTEAAFHLQGGVIAPSVPFGKFLTGVLCIGSGHSMGREGPSVQIGAGLASGVGQWLRLSPARIKELVPVGAAAALSAAFNTPVSAVVFALEEIIGDMNATLLGSTVVASVASVIVERSILGNEPLFHVPVYHLVHPAELGAYAILGIVGGLVSLVFCRSLLGLRRLFLRLPAWSKALQPAIGGVAIGVVLLYVPQVRGVGYEYVDQALNGGLLVRTLLLLCAMKLAATVVSYSSGNAGGIFAPSLYIGAMVGGVLGTIVHRAAPLMTGEPGAYALVGMGALFAGIIRAPMTSVFMIFEITQDYQILVPLMVANLLSFVISRRYQPAPVYHALLHQDGVHLPSPETKPGRVALTAFELMERDAPILAGDCSVEEAWQFAANSDAHALLVGSRDALAGIVTRERLAVAHQDGHAGDRLGSLIAPLLVHAHPDHSIDIVLDRFAASPDLLPIVSRADARRLEGVVTPESLVRFVRRDQRADGG